MVMSGQVFEGWTTGLRSRSAAIRRSAALSRSACDNTVHTPLLGAASIGVTAKPRKRRVMPTVIGTDRARTHVPDFRAGWGPDLRQDGLDHARQALPSLTGCAN